MTEETLKNTIILSTVKEIYSVPLNKQYALRLSLVDHYKGAPLPYIDKYLNLYETKPISAFPQGSRAYVDSVFTLHKEIRFVYEAFTRYAASMSLFEFYAALPVNIKKSLSRNSQSIKLSGNTKLMREKAFEVACTKILVRQAKEIMGGNNAKAFHD